MDFDVVMRARGGKELEVSGHYLVCVAAITEELPITTDEAIAFLMDVALTGRAKEVEWPYELRVDRIQP